ncbi:hypothetical protein N752_26675 [Desulforamulus aquiferis]|nr:hypothetical protein [Desulforamulus aquiferis]RYD02039.1 hypothetical protein N752_26675 [Desulforamulus aquiferis]
MAKPIAEKIAKHFNQTVVVVAGIHVEDASDNDIKALITNCWLCVEELLKAH